MEGFANNSSFAGDMMGASTLYVETTHKLSPSCQWSTLPVAPEQEGEGNSLERPEEGSPLFVDEDLDFLD